MNLLTLSCQVVSARSPRCIDLTSSSSLLLLEEFRWSPVSIVLICVGSSNVSSILRSVLIRTLYFKLSFGRCTILFVSSSTSSLMPLIRDSILTVVSSSSPPLDTRLAIRTMRDDEFNSSDCSSSADLRTCGSIAGSTGVSGTRR